jgi:hypothetical protein
MSGSDEMRGTSQVARCPWCNDEGVVHTHEGEVIGDCVCVAWDAKLMQLIGEFGNANWSRHHPTHIVAAQKALLAHIATRPGVTPSPDSPEAP